MEGIRKTIRCASLCFFSGQEFHLPLVSWDKLNIGKPDPITVQEILEKYFGVRNQDGFYMFDNAKTVIMMFCNGP